MPGCSLPSLPNRPGLDGTRCLLSEGGSSATAETRLRIGAAKGVGSAWTTSGGIRWTQLPHRCGYSCGSSRRRGLDYPIDGKMEQCSLPGLHQNPRLPICGDHLANCSVVVSDGFLLTNIDYYTSRAVHILSLFVITPWGLYVSRLCLDPWAGDPPTIRQGRGGSSHTPFTPPSSAHWGGGITLTPA